MDQWEISFHAAAGSAGIARGHFFDAGRQAALLRHLERDFPLPSEPRIVETAEAALV